MIAAPLLMSKLQHSLELLIITVYSTDYVAPQVQCSLALYELTRCQCRSIWQGKQAPTCPRLGNDLPTRAMAKHSSDAYYLALCVRAIA